MAGKNITQTADPLVKVTPEYLYHAIKNPKPELAAAIRQLRLVKNIDEKRYQLLKRQLPYVVTSVFHPPVRRSENFAYTGCFMADIDHLSVKDTSVEALKLKLMTDKRVHMMFASPGNDGLKVLFLLSGKMYDAAKYTLFYKSFLSSFSKQYELQQLTDTRTSDVTRACFFSHDPDAWYNETPEPINPDAFVHFENYTEVRRLKATLREEEETARAQNENLLPAKQPIDTDALAKIKATLNPNFREKSKKQIYVPGEVEQTVERVIHRMLQANIATTGVSNIHYGKKFKFSYNGLQAEINLFYGKRGFTAVISPRHGTNTDFNQLCRQILTEMFD